MTVDPLTRADRKACDIGERRTPAPLPRVGLVRRIGRLRQLLATLWFGWLCAIALPAGATGVNGLWVTTSGDYAVFMQDANSGASFAFQIPASFDSIRVWLGDGTSNTLALKSLANEGDTLDATYTASTMSGSTFIAGQRQSFDASLQLGWVASEYAGVWQKAGADNAYIVFAIFNSGGNHLGVQIDVTINADKTYAFDVFTGLVAGGSFNGVSVLGSGLASKLTFASGSDLTGQYVTATRPATVTPFSATHFIKFAQ